MRDSLYRFDMICGEDLLTRIRRYIIPAAVKDKRMMPDRLLHRKVTRYTNRQTKGSWLHQRSQRRNYRFCPQRQSRQKRLPIVSNSCHIIELMIDTLQAPTPNSVSELASSHIQASISLEGMLKMLLFQWAHVRREWPLGLP